MKYSKRFKSFKQRGESVELLFMAQAALRGFRVCTPWGGVAPFDVGIDHGSHFIRVQVKSSTFRSGTGYCCQFRPNYFKKQDYTLDQLDLFAAYVMPVDAWYLIPAAVLLRPKRKTDVTVYPVVPLKRDCYRYEQYREAWHLLAKSRRELGRYKQPR